MSTQLEKIKKFWESLNRIKDDPELMELINKLLDVYGNKDKLTPEGLEALKRFKGLTKCLNRLYCVKPKPTPAQARPLINEYAELIKGQPGSKEAIEVLERDFQH